jgi:hypothetical protein
MWKRRSGSRKYSANQKTVFLSLRKLLPSDKIFFPETPYFFWLLALFLDAVPEFL